MSFDPDKVRRLVIADESHHCDAPDYPHEEEVVVLAEDYDSLLGLYRKACAYADTTVKGGGTAKPTDG